MTVRRNPVEVLFLQDAGWWARQSRGWRVVYAVTAAIFGVVIAVAVAVWTVGIVVLAFVAGGDLIDEIPFRKLWRRRKPG